MNCTDCIPKLHEYVDGELAAAKARAVESHVAGCAACACELAAIRALVTQAGTLPKEISPANDLWAGIRAGVGQLDSNAGRGLHAPRERGSESASFNFPDFRSWFVPIGLAASIAVLFSVAQRSFVPHERGAAWSVAALNGAPRVDRKALAVDTTMPFRVGQWLETDATSRALVTVGSIGEVTVDPNSRLRLTTAEATNHRLDLQRGSLHAFVSAPPRLFFVETPSATAVDLGCAYTLKVDERGDGELHVLTGYVALEHGSRESIIPSGAMCRTRRGTGPGTPFAADAAAELRAAIDQFDFTPGAAASAVVKILASARLEDAVTLWHLLARTEGTQRAAVFDLLAKYYAPPMGVTRAGILAGDATMRRIWGGELGLGRFGLQ